MASTDAPAYVYLEHDDANTQMHVQFVLNAARANPEAPICIDLEFDGHDPDALPLSLIQLAVQDSPSSIAVLVFDAVRVPNIVQRFKPLLEAERPLKVMHGALMDAKVLAKVGIRLRGLFDTQLAHWLLHSCQQSQYQRAIEHAVRERLGVSRPALPRGFYNTQHVWMQRPLPTYALAYAANDVRDMPALFEQMRQRATQQQFATILQRGVQPRPHVDTVAREFHSYLQANPNVKRGCEDYEVFVQTLSEWKVREAVTGDIKSSLIKLGLATRSGATMAFPEGGATFSRFGRGAAARQALTDAAERVSQSRERIEANKGGISVSAFSFDEVVGVGSTVEKRIEIRNSGAATRVLRAIKLVRRGNAGGEPAFQLELESGGRRVAPDQQLELAPGAVAVLRLRFRPRYAGMHYDTLSLNFFTFSIGRFLAARCGDADLLDDLAPTAPFMRRRRRRQPPPPADQEVIEPPNEGLGGSGMLQKLAEWKLPGDLRRKLLNRGGQEAEELLRQGWELMKETSDAPHDRERQLEKYATHFAHLLWSEELQLHTDLSEFDLVGEKASILSWRGRHLALHVQGLAEKRPSVLKGDHVKVNLVGEPNRIWKGRAETIEMEDVLLRFNDGLHRMLGGQGSRLRVEVSFMLGRTPLRIFHQGVDAVFKQYALCGDDLVEDAERRAAWSDILFPPSATVALAPPRLRASRLSADAPLRFKNPRVQANAEQRQAVVRIVQGQARHVPYVIFGPPGTGKTTTVVEAIVQCLEQLGRLPSGFRILVCAPTNTAADLLCTKLLQWYPEGRRHLLRLMAYSRSQSEVPAELLACTNWDAANEEFAQPAPAEVLGKRVVVATLSLAGKLTNTAGVSRGHFDLVVVDEAGQATEPEAIAPVATLLEPGAGQLVLAGDPKQLGPVIHHRFAKGLGLACSLLERLMERPLYAPRAAGGGGGGGGPRYEPLVLTKLVQNFRSHPVLLELPNRLFYGGELQACADPALTHCCIRWASLPTQPAAGAAAAAAARASAAAGEMNGVPLLWDGVNGKDEREGNSPSWFNRDECVRVLEHIQDLLRERTRLALRPTGEDIGVITPYNKQAQKIQRLLQGAGLRVGAGGIKVGSTELFQGQERKVIIISTVRSNADHIGFDLKHNLGFLDNPKRFNVAVTRAQALLIIVGNPSVLGRDAHWGALLRHCHQRGAYAGPPLPPEDGGGEGGGGEGAGEGGGEGDAMHAQDLEELLQDDEEPASSEAFQQEGMEMPDHDS